ncbi:hypothetical protein GCM10010387_51130 [Streptomyces inusitatus]|uniref:Uncharacterized protein n=1 Tax=Streptomyces inusitatus TaxID=68221 RepID=A0A918QIU9_9ACTN|nr:hypothetical protein [Streptomyces inusitatus]GGZ50640.1 hypothetical protein GCM10010387_51130 [Streptomyces inusitatus]
MRQGPGGDWVCGTCATGRDPEPAVKHQAYQYVRCDRCLQVRALTGPNGGYVCGLCSHVVEPMGYAREREEGLRIVAAARIARTRARREQRAAGGPAEDAGE